MKGFQGMMIIVFFLNGACMEKLTIGGQNCGLVRKLTKMEEGVPWATCWKTWWQKVNVQPSRLCWLGFLSYHEPFSENSWNRDTRFGSSWND